MISSLSTPADAGAPPKTRRGEDSGWYCVQSGHREKYAIPRAFAQTGDLRRFITDLWVPASRALRLAARGPLGRLRDRWAPDIPGRLVSSFVSRTVAHDVLARWQTPDPSTRIIRRNSWWGRLAASELQRLRPAAGSRVFSYCYDALEVFTVAESLGLVPVLGQIDPGPVEDRKVAQLVARWPLYKTNFKPGSRDYYRRWRAECDRAVYIVTNSEWSRDALVEAGIPREKLGVHPLVYEPPAEARSFARVFPEAFTATQPLKVLFLGQCILRKGVAEVIAAAQTLVDEPVEFTLVGHTDIDNLPGHFGRARIKYWPRLPRAECERFFRESHVFLFPTHSDGFGLTQLEAQAWRLPIIASNYCGRTVVHEVNGLVLDEVSSDAIVHSLQRILQNPAALRRYSDASRPHTVTLRELAQQIKAGVEAVQARNLTPSSAR